MCISRKKRGKGYSYFDENGKRIADPTTLKRLKELVIPPMWTDVMLCRFDDGHIQAVGRDDKNRKQYIYHTVYEKQKQEEKFKKLIDFSDLLPKIRKRAFKDLKMQGWGRQKVIALVILLLDEYGIRIGNKEYMQKNDSYGLTTLRRRHISFEDSELILSFKGKSNQEQEVHIDNEELVPLIKKASELPGYEIFRYKDLRGRYHNINSDDINDYIIRYMGDSFSSKFFRTWAANRFAVEYYPIALEKIEKESRKKFSNILIKMVASELGNTPSICRDYYVHPAVFNSIDKKKLPNPNPYKKTRSMYALTASEKLARDVMSNSY